MRTVNAPDGMDVMALSLRRTHRDWVSQGRRDSALMWSMGWDEMYLSDVRSVNAPDGMDVMTLLSRYTHTDLMSGRRKTAHECGVWYGRDSSDVRSVNVPLLMDVMALLLKFLLIGFVVSREASHRFVA